MRHPAIKKDKPSEVRFYDKLDESARFREQYRSLFSVTIVATFFVIPAGNILELFLKWVLGFAMFFSAFYLICTAASIKYQGSKWMYNMFYVSERIRMRSYDLGVDCFAIGALYFVTLVSVGFTEKIFNFHPNEIVTGVLVGIVMLLYGLIISLASHWLKKLDSKSDDTRDLI